jgi:hypothetical protein
VTIVDDSGNDSWVEAYEEYPIHTKEGHVILAKVIALPRQGYNKAMQVVCREGAFVDRFLFWEEDFVLLEDLDLGLMDQLLHHRPYLAQLALMRGPWFEVEHQHGGLLEGLAARIGADNVQATLVNGVIEQIGTFTCNPSVWQKGIARQGWPAGQWSEDAFTRQLRNQGYKFGMSPRVFVTHDGVRSGYDY